MATRINNIKVSTWLNDRPGNHSCIENHDRPPLGTNLYNPTDVEITITIPAKSTVYLPGQFVNSKYAGTKIKFTEKHVTVQMPINAGSPQFQSAKVNKGA